MAYDVEEIMRDVETIRRRVIVGNYGVCVWWAGVVAEALADKYPNEQIGIVGGERAVRYGRAAGAVLLNSDRLVPITVTGGAFYGHAWVHVGDRIWIDPSFPDLEREALELDAADGGDTVPDEWPFTRKPVWFYQDTFASTRLENVRDALEAMLCYTRTRGHTRTARSMWERHAKADAANVIAFAKKLITTPQDED